MVCNFWLIQPAVFLAGRSLIIRALLLPLLALGAMLGSSDVAHATCGGGNFCATDGTHGTKIDLSWNDPADYLEYILYRKLGVSDTCPPTQAGCSGWTQIYQTYNQVAGYSDTAPQSGQMYQYWLCYRVTSGGNTICPQTGPAGNRRVTAWRAPPPIPTNLATTDGTETAQLRVSWSGDTQFSPSSYTLFRATNPHNCESGGSTLLSGISAASHNDFSATPGVTYFYSLKRVATNGGGSSACLTEGGGGWRKMSPPTNVVASATAPLQVTVNWNHPSASGAPSNGVVTYRVYRRQGSSSSVCSSGQQVGTVNGSSPVFTDTSSTGLIPGQNYYYAIRSEGQNGTLSDCSNANTSGANPPGYSISGGVFKDIGGGLQGAAVSIGTANTTTSASGTFSFTGLNNGNYTVTASKAGVLISPVSVPAFISGASVSGVTFTASCPSGQQFSGSSCVVITHTLAGTVRNSQGQALSGVTINGGALGSRTTNASGYYEYATVPFGTSYSIGPTGSGYTFTPSTHSGTAQFNNTSLDFTGFPLPPSAPTNVNASDGTSHLHTTISWSAPSGAPVSTYTVNRDGTPLLTVPAGTTSANDTTATPGVNSSYSVTASNSAGQGPSSAQDVGFRAMPAVSGVEASALPTQSAQVSWNALPDATSYRVYRSANCSGTFTTASAPTLVVDNLALDVTHQFSVKAAGANGVFASGSPCSNNASVTLPSATITVQIQTAASEPIPHAEVTVNGQPRGTTNASGALVINNLSAGTHVVLATKPNLSVTPAQHTLVLDYGDSELVTFTASCLQGFIFDEGSCEPIPAEPIIISAACISQIGEGVYRAYFSYTNPNGPVEIPVGSVGVSKNFFSPGSEARGQVTSFNAGSVSGAFSVEFDGSDLTWNVEYEGRGLRSATVNSQSAGCLPIVPEARCIAINPLGQIVARFGYQNPNELATPLHLPVGPLNRIIPAPDDQGQPTDFLYGTIASAFEIPLVDGSVAWSLNGTEAQATIADEVCAPGNNAPVASSGGPYSENCQGSLTNVQLNASASFDPDGNPLRYSWTTTCAEAIINNPTSAQPVLTLLKPGMGQSVSCAVTVTATDGLLSSMSQSTVAVTACALDCLGNPNGSAQIDACGVCGGNGTSCLDCQGVPFGTKIIDQCGVCGGTNMCLDCAGTPNGSAGPDRCGVCAGDGTSCLGCVETNLSDLITFLTRDFFTLRDINARALRRLKPIGGVRLSKRTLSQLRKIDFRYNQFQLDLYANLSPTVVSCTNAELCVQKDNSEILDRYSKIADEFLTGTRKATRRIPRFRAVTRTDKKRVKRAQKVHTRVKAQLLEVPRVVSSCE